MKESVRSVNEKLEEKQENMMVDSANSKKKKKERLCKHLIC